MNDEEELEDLGGKERQQARRDRRKKRTLVEEAYQRARRIVSSPALRSEYFEDPEATIHRVVPGALRRSGEETRLLRAETYSAMANIIQADPGMSSSVNAEAVLRQLRGTIRNPERSFSLILWLSLGAFISGIVLVAAGVASAVYANDAAVQAGLLSGGGVAGVLGSLYTVTKTGVSTANADHARLRMVLHSFAVTVGHLQAVSIKEFDEVYKVNNGIWNAAIKAAQLMETGRAADLDEKVETAGEGLEEEEPAPWIPWRWLSQLRPGT